MSNFLSAAQGFFGRMSGEERQLDFTGAGTVLLQSSEKVMEDPNLLQTVTQQAGLLSLGQLTVLQQTIAERVRQSQQQ